MSKVVNQSFGENWAMYCGDSVELMPSILPDNSVHLSVFSPPFQSLYVYTDTERDLGNCKNAEEFWQHFQFIISELYRATMPGRLCCVHVAQIATTLVTHGEIGLHDFRGDTIREFKKAGFVFHGEAAIDKNPQAQAIRTHAKGLLFAQLHKDSSWSRPGLADFILVFRKPGENPIPVKTDIDNETWIKWAHPVWYDIKETDTLNVRAARNDDDSRHICPLQLGTIERCVRLWSNTGEIVLSPFAGIGSEGYQAIKFGRRFIGIELKPEYYAVAEQNLIKAEADYKEQLKQAPTPVEAVKAEQGAEDELVEVNSQEEFAELLQSRDWNIGQPFVGGLD